MEDSIKLISVVLSAFLPVIGLLTWVIKSGMTGANKATASNTKAVNTLITSLAIQKVKEESVSDYRGRMESKMDDLIDIHAGTGKLCTFGPVDARDITRAAQVTLGN